MVQVPQDKSLFKYVQSKRLIQQTLPLSNLSCK